MLHFMARRVSSEQAERALAFAASTVESSDVGMTLYGMITGWNSGTERFCGYTTREVFGRWPIGITITEDELAKILKRVGRGERVNHYENIEVKKSGRRINVSVTVVADPEHRRKGRRGIFDRPRHDARKQAEAAICERDALRYVASLDSRAALARQVLLR